MDKNADGINIAIVEDDKEQRILLRRLVTEYLTENAFAASIFAYESGEDFVKTLDETTWSIIFMDVYMKEMNGIETAEALRKKTTASVLIFCTSSMDHMPGAFSTHAFDYIIKPPTKERITKILDDARQLLPAMHKYIKLRDKNGELSLLPSDIISVETQGHYLQITTGLTTTPFTVRLSLTELTELLEGDERFLQINRGVLVNMDNVSVMKGGECVMNNGQTLPIRLRDSASLVQRWNEYIFSQLRESETRKKGSR
ncbi:MAG: response regulator transcription factor [Parasporobacterium sp.]|nr:response regulator transcription factor [Parasporobacterium sp.]